jgi:hypothetical protein
MLRPFEDDSILWHVAAMIDWGQQALESIRFGTLQEWDYSLRRRLSDTSLWLSA